MSKDFLEKLQKLQETDQIARKSKDQRKLALLKEILLAYLQGMSDEEIAVKVGYSNTANVRSKITEICAYFNVKNEEGTRDQRLRLRLLFRDHKSLLKDEFFEFWKAITNVDKSLEESISKTSDRPQTPHSPQNIPNSDRTQELTTLEFIGRDRDLTNLTNRSNQYKIVLIKAGAGVGKSTLAREFLQTNFKKVIRIEMGLESGNVTPAEEKVSQILRKDFDEEPSRDFGINLDILREKLADRANPIAVLIDTDSKLVCV